jgi:hypothetical protein
MNSDCKTLLWSESPTKGGNMALEQDQKEYIKQKVTELGSIETVKRFYPKECLVDKWAVVYAHKLFDKVGKNKVVK